MNTPANQAWEAFRAFAPSISRESWQLFRMEASTFITRNHPGLEEVGSSDFNGFVVSMIEQGNLIIRPDGWDWKHRGWSGFEHEPRCTCGRLLIFCWSPISSKSPAEHHDDYDPEHVP